MIEQAWLFHCGYFRAFDSVINRGGSMKLNRIPFLAVLVIHPEKGAVLIDAPFGHEGPKNAGAIMGTVFRTFGQQFKREWSVVERIRECGFRAAEIDHVLMTHLHYDHTGGMKELAHANFHIHEDEWRYANEVGGLTQGYIRNDYRALQNVTTFSGETHDVFGDGSIFADYLPGHSQGHVGFRFALTTGVEFAFLGDAAFSVPQIEESVELGPFPKFAADSVPEAEATLNKIRKDAVDHPDMVRLVSHDVEWGEKCIRGPIPLHE